VRRLELSKDADADLYEILIYGSVMFGDEVARRYYFGIDEALKMLREYPEAGPVAWYLDPGLRRWTYHSHRIFYGYDDERLIVGRILHHSMDVDRSLRI
jgi:toxin ParE1/3/4